MTQKHIKQLCKEEKATVSTTEHCFEQIHSWKVALLILHVFASWSTTKWNTYGGTLELEYVGMIKWEGIELVTREYLSSWTVFRERIRQMFSF